MGEGTHFIAVLVLIFFHMRVFGDGQILPQYVLVFVFNRVKDDLIGAVTDWAFIGVLRDMVDVETGHFDGYEYAK